MNCAGFINSFLSFFSSRHNYLHYISNTFTITIILMRLRFIFFGTIMLEIFLAAVSTTMLLIFFPAVAMTRA